MGRHSKYTPEIGDKIIELTGRGMTQKQISLELRAVWAMTTPCGRRSSHRDFTTAHRF